MNVLANLLNEGLDLYEQSCTDTNGGLDEVCQREKVSTWLLANHKATVELFYGHLLLRAIAARQQQRCAQTRPTANQITSASATAPSASTGGTLVAIQPPLLADFAKEKYYVAPNVSKRGDQMSVREGNSALVIYLDLNRETQTKIDRLSAILALAQQRGLAQDDLLKKILI